MELEIFIVFWFFKEDYTYKSIVIPSHNDHFFVDSCYGREWWDLLVVETSLVQLFGLDLNVLFFW